MHSLPSFDGRYPVRTLYTDNEDWRRCEGWQDADRRKTALQDYLRTPLKQVIYAREIHSGSVFAVSGENNDPEPADGYDALVTADPGVLLCVWTADCLPLFLYDKDRHVAAVAHCGWRGICSRIVSNTVGVMTGRFGSSPEHIIAAFGPGICGACYEVSGDLIEAFSKRFSPAEIAELFCPKRNGKYLLDLRKAITFELLRVGIQQESIQDAEICSYESAGYASYRRDGQSVPSRQTLSGIVLEYQHPENR